MAQALILLGIGLFALLVLPLISLLDLYAVFRGLGHDRKEASKRAWKAFRLP